MVLNTCCIRENADQRLYGTLGRLKELVDAKPGLQIAVGGCLAQKDRERIQEKVGWVDVVFGTHNLTSAPGLLRRAETEGPVMEILDAPAPESGNNPLLGSGAVRELPYAAWVNIQTGCDNSCAFCIVPSVRGPEASRTPRRHRGGGGAAGPQRGHGGDAARAERELLRPRHHEAAAPLRRAAAPGRRGGGHRARPLHQPAPQGSAARDDRGHGGDARGLRAVAPAPAVRERPGAARHAARLHRGALPRTAGRGASRHRRPGRDDRHHRGVPGRDGGGLRGHAGACAPRPGTTARTPSSSPRVRGPEPPTWSRASCRRTSSPSGSSA